MSRRVLGVVVWLFLCSPGYSQTLGTITGEVKDESGASVPGATVTARPHSGQQPGRDLHVPGDAPWQVRGQG